MTTSEAIGLEAEGLVAAATGAGLTLGTAESCTGGLVSAAITAVSGSSAALRGGIVSYALDVKHEVLGVSQDVLDNPELGAVSAECAEQMSLGARKALGCDIAVSVTGIAGPTGAEPGKPVGTVWFGLSRSQEVKSICHHFAGDREDVRRQAVLVALRLLHEAIVETTR